MQLSRKGVGFHGDESCDCWRFISASVQPATVAMGGCCIMKVAEAGCRIAAFSIDSDAMGKESDSRGPRPAWTVKYPRYKESMWQPSCDRTPSLVGDVDW